MSKKGRKLLSNSAEAWVRTIHRKKHSLQNSHLSRARGRSFWSTAGGRRFSRWLDRVGLKSRFRQRACALPIKKTLEVVEMVLSGLVNKSFVSETP